VGVSSGVVSGRAWLLALLVAFSFWLGCFVACVAFGHWAANLTPFPKPAAEVTPFITGIYGWMRHPLYTAVGSAFLGWGLVRGSWAALFCTGFLLILLDRKGRREKLHLVSIFPGYQDYSSRVKRFIQWVY